MKHTDLTNRENELIAQSWKDCLSLLQGDSYFIPVMQFLNKEDELQISVIDKAEINALSEYLRSIEENVKFAVLNNCGSIRKNDQNVKCLISRIYFDGNLSGYYILDADKNYDFEQDIFSQVEEISYDEGKRSLSFVFDSPFENTRVTVMPSVEEMNEISELARNKDWNNFKLRLDNFDVNMVDGSGETILHGIMWSAPLDVIEYVLEKKADPNIANYRYGRTPAFYSDRSEVHELLIKYGLNINHQDQSGWTAAHYKIFDINVLQVHLEAGLDMSLKSIRGRNIVFEVVESVGSGKTKYLDLLYQHGAKLDEPDNWGLTPLHLATMYRDVESMDYFIKHYDNLDARTIKDVNMPISEPEILLPAGSTAEDIITTFYKWCDNATTEEDIELAEMSRSDYDIPARLLSTKESLDVIQNEEQEEFIAENEAKYEKSEIANMLNEVGILSKSLRRKRSVLLMAVILFFLGFIVLIVGLICNFSVLFGLGISVLAFILLVIIKKQIRENVQALNDLATRMTNRRE